MTPEVGRYVIITGHGRSGSNRLLDAYDLHPDTLCRNEANRLKTGVLSQFGSGFFENDLPSAALSNDFAYLWHNAIEQASMRFGARDRYNFMHKNYCLWPSLVRVLRHGWKSRKLRQTFGTICPQFRGDEWPIPDVFAEPVLLRSSVPVFKLLLSSGLLVRAFRADQNMRLVHNIRAPLPFIRSWIMRYVKPRNPAEVFEANRQDLDKILAFFNVDAPHLNEFNLENLCETELWRWRYVNELLFLRLRGADRYKVVTYDAFDQQPSVVMRSLYDFAGVIECEKCLGMLSEMKNTLFPNKVSDLPVSDTVLQSIIDRVMDGSPLNLLIQTSEGSAE